MTTPAKTTPANGAQSFVTCSFPEYQPDLAAHPVRISHGFPRYRLSYPLGDKLPALFPSQSLRQQDLARVEFAAAYTAQLDAYGVPGICRDAAALRAAAGLDPATPLALLCFEQQGKPARGGALNWCHRAMFAAWWTRNTGEPVPELGAPLPADADAVPLF